MIVFGVLSVVVFTAITVSLIMTVWKRKGRQESMECSRVKLPIREETSVQHCLGELSLGSDCIQDKLHMDKDPVPPSWMQSLEQMSLINSVHHVSACDGTDIRNGVIKPARLKLGQKNYHSIEKTLQSSPHEVQHTNNFMSKCKCVQQRRHLFYGTSFKNVLLLFSVCGNVVLLFVLFYFVYWSVLFKS